MAYALLTDAPLDAEALTEKVRTLRNGAYVTFFGNVRDHDQSQEGITELFYSAYEEMAEKMLLRVVKSAEEKWAGSSCAVAHRIGSVKVGESSITIVVGAAHRTEAFEACRWIIDTVKTTVPIWKRGEQGGQQFWIEGERRVAASAQTIEP